MYVVRHDLRLCPSPMCGGYWVALANAARTRCADGIRRPRCYVARAIGTAGAPVGEIPEESLVRGAVDLGRNDLGELIVGALYTPAGRAKPGAGFYRLYDNGIRCVREPCFSITVRAINVAFRSTVSGVDLAAAGASRKDDRRAKAALATKDGLYARGGFTHAAPDGGRFFRVLRLYLKEP